MNPFKNSHKNTKTVERHCSTSARPWKAFESIILSWHHVGALSQTSHSGLTSADSQENLQGALTRQPQDIEDTTKLPSVTRSILRNPAKKRAVSVCFGGPGWFRACGPYTSFWGCKASFVGPAVALLEFLFRHVPAHFCALHRGLASSCVTIIGCAVHAASLWSKILEV